jgi:hypothetical protein
MAPYSFNQPDHSEPDDDEMEDMPHGEMQAEGQRQGQRQAEVKALRRWLRNRGAKADLALTLSRRSAKSISPRRGL